MTHQTFMDFLIEGYTVQHRLTHGSDETTHVDYTDDGDDDHHVIQSRLGSEVWHKNNVTKVLPVADQPIRKKPDPVNSKERDEMSKAHMEAYGDFHVYFGGVLRNGGKGQDNQKRDYHGILSAIKERDHSTISPKAKAKMYQDAAREIVRQIRFEKPIAKAQSEKDLARKNSPLHDATNIILVPVPSSSKVPEEFAEVLSRVFQSETRNVTIAKAGELVQANKLYDVYPDHTKVAKAGASKGQRLTQAQILQVYNRHLIKDVEDGRRSPGQALRMLESNKQYIESTLDRLNDEDSVAAYDHLDAISLAIAQITNKTKPGAPNDTVRKYSSMMPIDRRTHVYNRMKVPATKIGETVDENTVVVIVDDNIEEGNSVFQTYRALLKGGVVKSSHAVVGAVAHKLGISSP